MSVLIFDAPHLPVDFAEVARYMRAPHETPELTALLCEVEREVTPLCSLRLCYRRVSVKHTETGVEIEGFSLPSADLARRLAKCNEAILLTATAGLALDRYIAREGRISPARALCAQALGTERVEALCDAFCEQMNETLHSEGARLTSRFSPGYGDLPLTAQHALFALLSPEKHVGVTLTDTLLMSPTKSVSAITGIEVLT